MAGHPGQVLTVAAGLVARNAVLADPRVFDVFGVPRGIPPGEFRPGR